MMTRRTNVVRDLCGLVLTVLGVLGLIALATMLGYRHEWLAVALLLGGVVLIGLGVRLGHYDPAPVPPAPGGRGDGIEMIPRTR